MAFEAQAPTPKEHSHNPFESRTNPIARTAYNFRIELCSLIISELITPVTFPASCRSSLHNVTRSDC
jgi:hypothetical protein